MLRLGVAISHRRALLWLAVLVSLPIVCTLGYLELQQRAFYAHARKAQGTVTYVGKPLPDEKTIPIVVKFTAYDQRVYTFSPVVTPFELPPVGHQLMVRYDERDPAHAFIIGFDDGPTDYSYVILFFIGFPFLQYGAMRFNIWNERRRAQSSKKA